MAQTPSLHGPRDKALAGPPAFKAAWERDMCALKRPALLLKLQMCAETLNVIVGDRCALTRLTWLLDIYIYTRLNVQRREGQGQDTLDLTSKAKLQGKYCPAKFLI